MDAISEITSEQKLKDFMRNNNLNIALGRNRWKSGIKPLLEKRLDQAIRKASAARRAEIDIFESESRPTKRLCQVDAHFSELVSRLQSASSCDDDKKWMAVVMDIVSAIESYPETMDDYIVHLLKEDHQLDDDFVRLMHSSGVRI